MINETILFLTVSDCSNYPIVQKWNIASARGSDVMQTSVAMPLKKLFSNVVIYDYRRRYIEVGVKKTNEEILDCVKKIKPQYVVWPSSTYEILESTFDQIKQFDAKILGWFFDDEVRFDEYSKWWIPHLDYCLTVDKEALQKYKNLGGNAIYLPVLSNSDIFKRLNLQEKYDLSFVGTKIADREELVKNLRAQGFSVEAFGRGWDTGFLSLENMIEVYNTSRINLCFMKSYGVNTRPQMKNKIFDICMCGGFLLCEYIPGIEDYYDIGQEIACFNDIKEAAEKIKYYLSHDSERRRIAQAGYERACRDHSACAKLSEVFKEIGEHNENGGYQPQISKNIPKIIEQKMGLPAAYHLSWAKVLLFEGKIDLSQDEIKLALNYDPSGIEARFISVVLQLPTIFRLWLIQTYTMIRKLLGVRSF